MAEATDTVSSVISASADFSDPSSDVPIVKNEIVKKDVPRNLRDLTSKEDCVPSALQCIHELCRTICLSVPSDVRSVQGVIKHALEVFVSGSGNEASLADLKEAYAAEKAELEKSLAESEKKLGYAERGIQELEHNKDTLVELMTKVDEAEAYLKSSEEHVRFLED